MPQLPESSLSTWSAPGSPISLDDAASVLDQIQVYVLEGFQRLSHGGMEVGGVLFGSRDGAHISLRAWRPIPCEYSRGPSFVLSEADKSDLRSLLAACARDPELSRLKPVGWFASHTRSELDLLESDREFFEEFFPDPWQVTLLLQPRQNAPALSCFFYRDPEGVVWKSPVRELDPVREPAPAARRPKERGESAGQPRPVEVGIREPERPAITVPAERNHGFRWGLLVVVIAILAAAAAAAALYSRAPASPPPLGPFAFDAVDTNGQLRIHWDQSAKAVREASRGILEIHDAGKTARFDLDTANVRGGSVTYARQGDDVSMRLTVYEPSGASLTQLSRFVGPPPTRGAEVEALRQERDRLNAQVASLRSALQAERDKTSRLERENKLRERLLQLDNVIGRHRTPATK